MLPWAFSELCITLAANLHAILSAQYDPARSRTLRNADRRLGCRDGLREAPRRSHWLGIGKGATGEA